MQLSFQKLEINNFKCFSGENSLDLAAYRSGLIFLRGRNEVEEARLGSNGAGKSTIWDALCWCLYGKTPGGLRNPDIEPWSGPKKTLVTLTLEVEGQPFTISRSTHPNRLTACGEDVSQEQLIQGIGLTYEVFTHTILMGQGRPLFFDLSPKDKMGLFTDVLALDIWDARAATASARVAEFQDRAAAIGGQLTQVEIQLAYTAGEIEKTRDKADAWEADRQARLKDSAKDRRTLAARKEELERQLDEADLAYDGAETELAAIDKESLGLEEEVDRLVDEHRAAQSKLETDTRLLASLKRQMQEMAGGTCPTCGQAVKVKSGLGVLVAEHDALLNVVAKGAPKPKALVKVEKVLANLLDAHYKLKDRSKEAAETRYNLSPEFAEVKAKLKALTEGTDKAEAEINPHYAQVETLNTRLEELAVDEAELKSRSERLGRIVERNKYWVKGFKDVRLFLIEEVLAELEITTNAALEELGLLGWEVKYEVERETKSGTISRGLNVTILSPRNESPVRWESWSGGEGQRLRVIGALALSEVLLNYAGVQTDLEILDEPTQHLSTEGVKDLCEYLATRAKQLGRKTWYVDHSSVESARFTDIVTITKTNKGARVDG